VLAQSSRFEIDVPADIAADCWFEMRVGARGTAVVVRHQPSGEVIGTVTPFGLGSDGVGRFAIPLPRDLEARLRRDHQPLRLKLEAHGANSGASDDVVLRSVAPKLVPTAQ